MNTPKTKFAKLSKLSLSEMSKIKGGEWMTFIVDGKEVVVWING